MANLEQILSKNFSRSEPLNIDHCRHIGCYHLATNRKKIVGFEDFTGSFSLHILNMAEKTLLIASVV